MLTIKEKHKIKKLIEIMEQRETEIIRLKEDKVERLRDELGRFRSHNELQTGAYQLDFKHREIKLVKEKGTYGTFLVKRRRLSDADKEILIIFAVIVIIAIIF